MRIALRLKQVQSSSRAACSTDAIRAHLLPSLPTSLNADGREPICPASAPAQYNAHAAGGSGREWL